jgi:RNA polymerase sigma-70 factor (ECF subfamily)
LEASKAAQPSDVELLERIKAGDGRAVGDLYDRYAAMLFPLSLRIVRDRGEAEDVLHDAFITVSERAAQYVPERGAVVAWLVTLVRNLSIDRTRRRDRRGAITRDILAYDPEVKVDSPEELTSDAAERHTIRKALGTLPEAQQRTLVLAFFEGKSYPEIAEEEGVPLGTIKSRAARALGALRVALDASGVDLGAALGVNASRTAVAETKGRA